MDVHADIFSCQNFKRKMGEIKKQEKMSSTTISEKGVEQ